MMKYTIIKNNGATVTDISFKKNINNIIGSIKTISKNNRHSAKVKNAERFRQTAVKLRRRLVNVSTL